MSFNELKLNYYIQNQRKLVVLDAPEVSNLLKKFMEEYTMKNNAFMEQKVKDLSVSELASAIKYKEKQDKSKEIYTYERAIRGYIKENTLTVWDGEEKIKLDIPSGRVVIELPSANREWTYKVWDWVKGFTNLFDRAYPIHIISDGEYQFIDINYYLGKDKRGDN